MHPQYFYLDVECAAGRNELSVRRIIEEGIKSVFGECGVAALNVDVLSVKERRALLRVHADNLRKLRAALTLATELRVQAHMSGRCVLSAGAHVVVVAPRDELAAPSSVLLPEPEPAPGLILPDGDINWGCPCLGGMATGPCGAQFRDAFSCFHYSEAEPKGSDCYEKFSVMQQCMSQFPELYGKDDDDELATALQHSGDAAPSADTPADTSSAAADTPADTTATSTAAASTADHK